MSEIKELNSDSILFTSYGLKRGFSPYVWTPYNNAVHETAKAILIKMEDENVWMPKSQMYTTYSERFQDILFLIPKWLWDKKCQEIGNTNLLKTTRRAHIEKLAKSKY